VLSLAGNCESHIFTFHFDTTRLTSSLASHRSPQSRTLMMDENSGRRRRRRLCLNTEIHSLYRLHSHQWRYIRCNSSCDNGRLASSPPKHLEYRELSALPQRQLYDAYYSSPAPPGLSTTPLSDPCGGATSFGFTGGACLLP